MDSRHFKSAHALVLLLLIFSFTLMAAKADYYYRLSKGPAIPIEWPKEDSDKDTKVSVESLGANQFRIRITDWNLKTRKIVGDYIWIVSAVNFPVQRILYPGEEFTVSLKAEIKKCFGVKSCKGGAGLHVGDAGTFIVVGVNPPKDKLKTLKGSTYCYVNKKKGTASRDCRFRVPNRRAKKIWMKFVTDRGKPLLRSEWEMVERSGPDRNKIKQAEAYAREGLRAYRNRDWAGMEQAYQKALSLTPDNDRYWNELATAYWQQGKYTQAEEAHRKSIRLNPNVGLYHANLAGVLWKLGRINEARAEANVALRLGFRNHWIFKTLGLLR